MNNKNKKIKSISLDFKKIIDNNDNIIICSHRSPDGDTLGSALALKDVLSSIGKNVEVLCKDEIPYSFKFLPEANTIKKDIDLSLFSVCIFVDAATKGQTGFGDDFNIFKNNNIRTVNLDHHISNENFADVNLIDEKSCSTAMLIYKILNELKIEITKNASTCLLNGVMTDTGSLQHDNTTPEVYRVVASLLKKKAELQDITKNVFRANKVEVLKLWGRVLERVEISKKNIIVSSITKKDLIISKAEKKDIAGVVNYLSMVQNIKYAMLLNEDEGFVKGSLRTNNNDVNVSEIASKMGGGGHKKAAGFRKNGKLKIERSYKIVD